MTISFEYDSGYPGPAFPVMEISLSNHKGEHLTAVTAYIDTGSDASTIPLAILGQIAARHLDHRWARAIEGTRYAVNTYLVTIHIGSEQLNGIQVIANEHTDEVIIGRDVLNQLHLTLDGLGLTTTISQLDS
ncbi:MAG: retroviral-like aspartic protease family protein [Anaerolineales bacterium]|nr:retroviral-like aspartic protease family protein [Anaerolineales bacterium]